MTVAVQPDKHAPEPLPWTTVLGLFRASADAGLNALQYAESKGIDIGRERARREFEKTTGDEALRDSMDALTAKVSAFEEASGISIAKEYDLSGLGEIVATVRKIISNPKRFKENVERQASNAERSAQSLREVAKTFEYLSHNSTDARYSFDEERVPGVEQQPSDKSTIVAGASPNTEVSE